MTGNALLWHADGKLPNLALMRLSHFLKSNGDSVTLRRGNPEPTLFDEKFTNVYGSCIFESTKPVVERFLKNYPEAVMGGTGWRVESSLDEIGVMGSDLDYSLYPEFKSSIGFTQRGCRLKCSFCVVPKKEGAIRAEHTIGEIYRGDPYPREILLLDNDFFGQPHWRDRIAEARNGKFKVCFSQGINARCITDEAAEAIASIDYRDDSFGTKRIYTAWDNRADESRLFAGLSRLTKYGVKPDHIMVYMLVGYWPGETEDDRLYRQRRLREFGARPYPMPFQRTQELVGFQRWVVGAYDKRISWRDWKDAAFRPERLRLSEVTA
jgi:hypothetical protein